MAGVNDYRIEIKMKLFLQAGGKEGHRNKYALGGSRGRQAIKPTLTDFY